MGFVTSLSDHNLIVLAVANSIYIIIHDLKSDEFSQAKVRRRESTE